MPPALAGLIMALPMDKQHESIVLVILAGFIWLAGWVTLAISSVKVFRLQAIFKESGLSRMNPWWTVAAVAMALFSGCGFLVPWWMLVYSRDVCKKNGEPELGCQ